MYGENKAVGGQATERLDGYLKPLRELEITEPVNFERFHAELTICCLSVRSVLWDRVSARCGVVFA